MVPTAMIALLLCTFSCLVTTALVVGNNSSVRLEAIAPKQPQIGNNNSVPLLTRLAAGHIVSPIGPQRFRRFKVWLPWYQSYIRWCFQTRAGKRCKHGDCCLWHMECVIDLREHFTLGFPTNKVRIVDIEDNWPHGIFGTGRYQERLAYGASDNKALYHRLEVASTRLAIVLSLVPDCPCLDDTAALDITFAFCAQNMPGLKGVTRLPKKLYEYGTGVDYKERERPAGYFSKSTMSMLAEAALAICTIAVVTSSYVVCRCYYRKPGPLGTGAARVPNILRWRNRRQQQLSEPVAACMLAASRPTPPPPVPKKTLKLQKRKRAKNSSEKTRLLQKSKSKGAVQESRSEVQPIVDGAPTQVLSTAFGEHWPSVGDNLGSGMFLIQRKPRVEWAICPTCDSDFEIRNGIACKSQKWLDEAQRPAIRYFCSNECLRQRPSEI